MILLTLSPEEWEALETLTAHPTDAHRLRRAQALLWLDEGRTGLEVAARLRGTCQAVYKWVAHSSDTSWPVFLYVCLHTWHAPGPSLPSKSIRFPHTHIQPMILPGFPTTRAKSGTSFTTTAPAPIKAYFPIVTPHTIVQLAPRVAPCRTRVGRSSSIRLIWLRGLNTFVNTIEGPQNTSSSSVTPSYTETLFWIFTPLPMLTFGPITTF